MSFLFCLVWLNRSASGIPECAGCNARHSRGAGAAGVPSAQGSSGGSGQLAEERPSRRFAPGVSFWKVSGQLQFPPVTVLLLLLLLFLPRSSHYLIRAGALRVVAPVECCLI